jgi:hypothetical protein
MFCGRIAQVRDVKKPTVPAWKISNSSQNGISIWWFFDATLLKLPPDLLEV